MTLLIQQIIEDASLPPVTLRGNVRWLENFYEVVIRSDSKKFSYQYSYKPENK